MLYDLLRPAIFRLSADDPERAHEWVMQFLALAARSPGAFCLPEVASARLSQSLFGRRFPNPVGLAAGFDKNAVALRALFALGFGFVEAGTVTLHAQPGNPRPRIVRLPEQQALINRMGFNNDGAAAIARRLARTGPLPAPLGISLGKSRITPLEEAVADYRGSLRLLAPFADYIAVNVSSPNTPGLRALQERDQIEALILALQAEIATLGRRLPLLVKVAPDLTDEALDELLGVCLERGVDGVIAVNTTIQGTGNREQGTGWERPTVPCSLFPVPAAGGLSGRPLFPRALETVRRIRRVTEGRLPIIGVGGIFSAADAYAMIRAGASLVQLYTGLIYEGPLIARRINIGLLRQLRRDGFRSIADAVGTEERPDRRPLSPQSSVFITSGD